MTDHSSHIVQAEDSVKLPAGAPVWACLLFRELRRARDEIETLRQMLGVHVVSRKEAARLLGKSERTLKRWEERGLLERLNVSAPGVWYDHQAVLNLRRMS